MPSWNWRGGSRTCRRRPKGIGSAGTEEGEVTTDEGRGRPFFQRGPISWVVWTVVPVIRVLCFGVGDGELILGAHAAVGDGVGRVGGDGVVCHRWGSQATTWML